VLIDYYWEIDYC